MSEKFIESINIGYSFKGESIILGAAMYDGECNPNAQIKVPITDSDLLPSHNCQF
jgi:hypothetical protein